MIEELNATRGRGNIKYTVVAGAIAGNVTVTGIEQGDELIAVLALDFTLSEGAPNTRDWDVAGGQTADLTSEFSVSAADTINNTGGTSSLNKILLVVYQDLT